MKRFEDDTDLITELRAQRPTPSPAFAAKLDERAAAGFPPRPAQEGSAWSRLAERARGLAPRQLLIPVAGTALAAVVAATVVVSLGEPGTDRPSSGILSEFTPIEGSSDSLSQGGQAPAPTHPGAGVMFSEEPPALPSSSSSKAGAEAQAGSAVDAQRSASGPFASHARDREVERSAEMILGTDPSEVGEDAAKVFDAVHANNGIVLSSSIEDGAAGDAGAEFELLIPSAKLGDALADFSAIAEVRSRHEATADITAPTVGLGERLQDSRARTEGLLDQLAAADTDAERAAAEAELRSERQRAATLRSQLTDLQRRANLAHVSLRIETGAESTPSDDSGGGWGIDDALGDAGHILAIAAGVAIVGLAIVGPIALIALLLWLANRTRVRRGRERALS